jgi:hypothetical protein
MQASQGKPAATEPITVCLLALLPPVGSGGGWVNDSKPEVGFQETVNKSKAIHSPSRFI